MGNLRPSSSLGLGTLGPTGKNMHRHAVHRQFLPFDSGGPVCLKPLPNNPERILRQVSSSDLSPPPPRLWLGRSLGSRCCAVSARLLPAHPLQGMRGGHGFGHLLLGAFSRVPTRCLALCSGLRMLSGTSASWPCPPGTRSQARSAVRAGPKGGVTGVPAG